MAGFYYAIQLILACATLAHATTIVPWTRACIGEKELTFFDKIVNLSTAKEICQKASARRLVKIGGKATNDVIYDITRNDPNWYFTGATDRRGNEVWMWQDKSRVPGKYATGAINGYSNWSPDTLGDKYNKSANCMAVSSDTGMWQLVDCDGKFKFVCQKNRPAKDRNNVAVLTKKISADEYHCESHGCPRPAVTWYYPKGGKVPTSGPGVYQNVSTGQSILYVQNATVNQSGEYVCREEAGKSATAAISIQGVPTIISDARKPICHTNVTLRWRPNHKAVTSPHTVVVQKENGSTPIVQIKTTPTSDEEETSLADLEPDTTYSVKITACISSKNCPQTNRATGQIITKENPRPPMKPTLSKINNLCKISWQSPSATASYKLTLHESLTQSRVKSPATTTEIDLNAKKYSFIPGPNKNYAASVIAIDCGLNSTKVDVTGSCRGFPRAPEDVREPEIKKMTGDNSPTVTVKTPNESNGLISCLLVMVTTKDGEAINETTSYNFGTLQKINEAICIGTTYIAAAIPNSNLSTRSIKLGDGSETSCDPWDRQPAINRQKRFTSFANFTGRNRALTGDKTYRVFIVSTSPSNGRLLVKRSPESSVHTDPEKIVSESYYGGFDLISFIIGFLIPTIFLLLVIVWVFRLKKQLKKERGKTLEERESNYDTIMDKDDLVASTDHVTYANQAAIELQEASSKNGGYEVPLAPKDRQLVEPAYECYTNL